MGIAVSVVIALAFVLNIWSKFTLLHGFRVDDYLATPRARMLYWISRIAPLVLTGGFVAASYFTGIWWVETAAWVFFIVIACRASWAVWMRNSGRYREYYQEHQWK